MTRTYVAPVSFGLGDLVVSLPAIQALITEGSRTGAATWLVARSPVQARLAERIDGLAGCVSEDAFDPDPPDVADARVVDLRDHPLQRDHWWGSAAFVETFGDLGINDILGRICADFGIEADFVRPVPLRATPRPDVRDFVVLVTETDGSTKSWPADRWGGLAAEMRALDLAVRRVARSGEAGEDGEAGIPGVDVIVAPTPGDAVDVLTSCRAVVGVDTGLTHIAAQQHTPTVTICRRDDVFFRPWPHCRAVRGAPCDPACVAVEETYAHNQRVDLRGFQWQPRTCPTQASCLDLIQPEHVFAALQELL